MDSQDLNLPNWGPYGKEYVGLSHIADAVAGDRWDCFVMPGYHRRAVVGPYALRENHWHPWKANADLSSYTLRYELEWKDRVSVDVTYEGVGSGRYVQVHCVNNTDLPQSLDVHMAACLTRNPLRPAKVDCPQEGMWIGALDYERIVLSNAEHRTEQMQDGLKPGAWSQCGAVGASGLGGGNFFQTTGDRVEYKIELKQAIREAVLVFRYHRWTDSPCRVQLSGLGCEELLNLDRTGNPMSQLELPIGDLSPGSHRFTLFLRDGQGLFVEGFAILPNPVLGRFGIIEAEGDCHPEISKQGNVLQLKYPGIKAVYEITPPQEFPLRFRRISGEDVPAIVSERANDSVHDQWSGHGTRVSQLISCGPIPLAPGESRSLMFQVGFPGEAIKHATPFNGNFDPMKPYAFGMERLAATTLTNVVFPVRHREVYVRHHCPGRWWDSLYSWDSGMIGLGLAALDLDRAKDCLNQYLLSEDDPYAAFVEHGTPLPIQAELAREIWDRTQDPDWLRTTYPGLCNFYEWLAGRTRKSTTDRFQTGLLQSWDYFYNSGGWDDYPPQHALTTEPLRRRRIAPCVTTSFAIRFACHMKVFAQALGFPDDDYRKDIQRWAMALEHAWDEESGYYAYLEHDTEGNPLGIFRHESGENYNCGFDGIMPMVTGVLPEARCARLRDKLFDPSELWTEWGGTTVSQSAAYFSDSGYWNGAVWMPHNYLFWKALKEQGMEAEARKLANALLGCWEREVQASYHCFELFRADTGRGAGWHQFSGLSAPLLDIYRQRRPDQPLAGLK
jgi:hypothetical protein